MSSRVLALALAGFFLAGCTGTSGVGSSGPAGAAPSDATASVLVGLPAAQLATQGIDVVRYAGFDAAGAIVFRGVERPPAATHLLSDVPTDTTLLQVEYVDEGQVEALGHHAVDLSSGGSATVPQAEFAPPPSALASLAVTPRTERVAAGFSTQLQATATLDDGRVLDYTPFVFWSSSDAGVAGVGLNSGLATGVAPGTATVTIQQAGRTATGTVVVSNATLTRMDVLPSLPGIIRGVPQPLQAVGSFSDGSQLDLTSQVTWSTSDGAVLTVTPQGVATGIAVGASDATATSGLVSGSVAFQVHDSAGLAIEVEAGETHLADGTATQARAYASVPDGTRQDVTLTSTWTATAGVLGVGSGLGRQGFVTALNPGTGSVTATLGAASGSASLEVTSATVTSLALDPPAALSAPGAFRAWRVLAATSDGRSQDVTRMAAFASSDPAIVDVSNFSSERGVSVVGGPGGETADVSVRLPALPPTDTAPLHTGLYLYLVSEIFGQVIGLQPDLTTGALTWLQDLQGSESPDDLLIHPSGLFVYVLNFETDSVSAFSVAPDTGLLTGLGDFPVPDCTCSSRLAIDPRGRFLYVPTGNTGDITLFAIDPDTGLLSDLGVVGPCGNNIVDAAVRPDGRFLYIADVDTEQVAIYAIDPETGALGPPTQFTPGGVPQVFTFDPLGRFAWLTFGDVFDIRTYAVNPWTGAWTQASIANPVEHPASIVSDPKARFVYSGTIEDGSGREDLALRGDCGRTASLRLGAEVADCGCEDTVEGFTVGAGGSLTASGVATTQAFPTGLAVDPTGRFAWAASYSNQTVSGFALDQTSGAPTPLTPRDLELEQFGLFHLMATP